MHTKDIHSSTVIQLFNLLEVPPHLYVRYITLRPGWASALPASMQEPPSHSSLSRLRRTIATREVVECLH